MVYKLGNVADLEMLSSVSRDIMDILYEELNLLSKEYGSNRDIDNDDGGYVVYATKGTPFEDIKAVFDCSMYTIEYVDYFESLCKAFYIVNNEFVVTIVMHIEDIPKEVKEMFEC